MGRFLACKQQDTVWVCGSFVTKSKKAKAKNGSCKKKTHAKVEPAA